jgi:integrase
MTEQISPLRQRMLDDMKIHNMALSTQYIYQRAVAKYSLYHGCSPVAGFGNWFRERCDEADLPHCTSHGLRKAAATVAAENGATAHELMSICGWLTLKEAERYTRAAERKRLAERGMGRLVPIRPGTQSV